MTVKELAREVIDALPENSTMDDVIHALYVRAKFDHGEHQIRNGQGVSQEDARQRLRKWAG